MTTTNRRERRHIMVAVMFLLGCTNPTQPPGLVSTASPEAASAGQEILTAGGNAIDAAVAVQFALAVTEPAMSGLGGQTQLLVQRVGEDAFVINGTSYSPSNIPRDVSSEDLQGHRATTIPATVKTLAYAWQRFGSGDLQWSELLAPAIRFAEFGFEVGEFRHKVWKRHHEQLGATPATATLFLKSDGAVPGEGEVFRQPKLAATLRRLAELGADDFYTGSIAEQIAADMAEHGGWITEQDLASVAEPVVMPALTTTYRGSTISSLPPPGGGWVVLQILNMLEQIGDSVIAQNEDIRLRSVSKALRIGHTSRQQDPISDLADFQAEVANRIDKATARRLWKETPPISTAQTAGTRSGGETTHFSVVDANGTVVSATASINAYFGARAASPELGFLYNDYMHEFELDQPDHPFSLQPNARPYSSMSPTIVSRDGSPVLVVGSPGSARIISAVAQVVHHWIDVGESVVDAVSAPRSHVVPPNSLYLESDVAPGVDASWIQLDGFVLTWPDSSLVIGNRNAYFGGVHAIAYERGRWVGAADPRRDGAVR